jgi:hypothetical protein
VGLFSFIEHSLIFYDNAGFSVAFPAVDEEVSELSVYHLRDYCLLAIDLSIDSFIETGVV